MQTLDFFNEITKTSKFPCIQYIGDNGKEARRGYWSGGVHIWENLKSQGTEHMCVGPVPVGKNRITATGLRVGDNTREYDELRAGMVTLEKMSQHWEIPEQDCSYLQGIEWSCDVVCTKEFIMDANGLKFTNAEELPVQTTCMYFQADQTLADVLSCSKLWIVWFPEDHHQVKVRGKALLRFENTTMGGAILSWDCSKGGKELIETNYKTIPIRFRRDGKTLTLIEDENMPIKVAKIPGIPRAEEEPVKEEVVEKAEEMVHKEEPETPDLPIIPPKEEEPIKEKPKKPFEGLDLEELLEQLEESIGKVKEAIQPMVPLLKAISKATKNSASSNEVKSLKAEVKELQTQNKQLEKALDKKTKALKLLVGGDEF